MIADALERLRAGVAKKKFTLTRIAELADVPLATLSDWSDDKRKPSSFDRFDRVMRAIDLAEAEASETETQGEGAPTAA